MDGRLQTVAGVGVAVRSTDGLVLVALEPDKVGEFAWIAPGDRPPDLYPASAALLDRLPAR